MKQNIFRKSLLPVRCIFTKNKTYITYTRILKYSVRRFYLPTYFKCWSNKNETMLFNSDGMTGYLEKWVLLKILVKVLSKVYITSCRFSKMINFQARWIRLGHNRRTVFSYTFKQNLSQPCSEIFDCTSLCHENNLCLSVHTFWDRFQTSITLDKLARSSYGSIRLRQHFYQNYLKKLICQGIQWYHQNWNVFSDFYYINILNVGTRLLDPYMKSFLKLFTPNQILIVISNFRLIWGQTKSRLESNLSEICNYNFNLVWINKIWNAMLCNALLAMNTSHNQNATGYQPIVDIQLHIHLFQLLDIKILQDVNL